MTILQKLRHAVVRTLATTIAVVGALEVTTHLPSQGRSSEFYHYISDQVALPILRRLDPETAHKLGLELAKRGLAPTFRPSAIEQRIDVTSQPFAKHQLLKFENCVGLAAGFDKDGEAIQPLLDMGFGFVEIGSVTPEPQLGNPKPRMFRLIPEKGIINRYGFNSQGCEAVAENLRNYRNPTVMTSATTEDMSSQPLHKTIHLLEQVGDVGKAVLSVLMKPPVKHKGILGVNLGKNKNSEDEIADYQRGIQQLGPYADYLVINISSPNTPGLHNLQQAQMH
jgi:dihydroorotate dehydrogenase